MTISNHIRTSFGLLNGRIVSALEVANGMACDCTCPGCGAALIAKQGKKVVWHFSHYRAPAHQSCVETAIHAAAKQVLLEENWLRVPRVNVTVERRALSGKLLWKEAVVAEERVIRFDTSKEEVWEVNMRPDVVGYRGDKRMLVEMYFSHQVDEKKLEKIQASRLPAIEIDLSDLDVDTGFDAIRQRVLEGLHYKEWLFHPGLDKAKELLSRELDGEIESTNTRELIEKERAEQRTVASLLRQQKKESDIAEANKRYRESPRAEKIAALRKGLSIDGAWPYFLMKKSEESGAICEPPQIWQSALFLRFIFGKAKLNSRIEIDTVQVWIAERFGIIEGQGHIAVVAIRKYLGYLAACGFIHKATDLYGRMIYTITNNTLKPDVISKPGIAQESHIMPRAIPEPIRKPREAVEQWFWKASWPDTATLLAAAAKNITPSTGVLLTAVKGINRYNAGKLPVDFAKEMVAFGISEDITLQFLVDVGLALKRSRLT